VLRWRWRGARWYRLRGDIDAPLPPVFDSRYYFCATATLFSSACHAGRTRAASLHATVPTPFAYGQTAWCLQAGEPGSGRRVGHFSPGRRRVSLAWRARMAAIASPLPTLPAPPSSLSLLVSARQTFGFPGACCSCITHLLPSMFAAEGLCFSHLWREPSVTLFAISRREGRWRQERKEKWTQAVCFALPAARLRARLCFHAAASLSYAWRATLGIAISPRRVAHPVSVAGARLFSAMVSLHKAGRGEAFERQRLLPFQRSILLSCLSFIACTAGRLVAGLPTAAAFLSLFCCLATTLHSSLHFSF